MTDFIVRAVARMRRDDVIYLIVGEMGENLRGQMEPELGERLRVTGYVDEKSYSDYCNLVDIAIDLRYQTMGESSAGICRILAAGKPCVVSNFGWFAEIPDGCAVKMDPGADEEALTRCLAELIADEGRRREIGARARAYIRDHHGIERAAEEYVKFVDEVRDVERSRIVPHTLISEAGRAMVELGVAPDDNWLIDGVAREIASLFSSGRSGDCADDEPG